MEEELFAGRHLLQQPPGAGGDNSQEKSIMPDLAAQDDSNDPELIITLYMRFKRGLDQDEEGNYLHMDYLMEKFKHEFDSQLQLAEVRKEKGLEE